MGCGASAERTISNRIDEELRIEHENAKRKVKILFLGAGESGKSTVVKQLRIIHSNGYNYDDCMKYKSVVYKNTIQSMLSVICGMKKLGINFSSDSRPQDAERLFEIAKTPTMPQTTSTLDEILSRLWNDEGLQECFSRSREYQLYDSAEYFLNEAKRIFCPDYIPTVQDILKTRVRTIGVMNTKFFYKELYFEIIDVGGQRSERRKWLRCFEGVTAIIFCTALSEYDLVLEEDEDVNRMEESLKLYDRICNNRLFTVTSIIIFLNKRDIFMDKIRHIPLTVCFPEYEGPNTYEAGTTYIKDKFEALNKSRHRKEIYSHLTCATDTRNIQYVFDVATDVIIKVNQKECGLF